MCSCYVRDLGNFFISENVHLYILHVDTYVVVSRRKFGHSQFFVLAPKFK